MYHKYEIDDVDALSVREVADQYFSSILDGNERIGDVRLECGCDLDVDILVHDTEDGWRIGRTETLTLSDLREDSEAEIYFWAKDCENGEWVLLCKN